MDTTVELLTDITNVREVVPEGESHETEELNVLEKVFGPCPKKRIVYRKDFLIECFNHPASSRCPSYPEFATLDCTLAEARLKDINKAMYCPAASSISLRPQSGNFSSGCAPNLSPAFGPPNRHHRFQNQSDDQPKGMYDTGFSRRVPGVGPPRFEHDRRDIGPRDSRDLGPRDSRDLGPRDSRDLGPRDSRDLGPRDNRDLGPRDSRDIGPRDSRDLGPRDSRDLRGPNMNYGRRPMFRSEQDSDWTRRRSFNRNDDHMGRMRMGRDRDDDEPEWFTGGPTSQNETIELHGFQDDERRLRRTEEATMEPRREEYDFRRNGATQPEVPKEEPNLGGGNLAFSLEKILQMETENILSDLLPAASGKSSRFAALFSPAAEQQPPQPFEIEAKSHETPNMLEELFAPKQESRAIGGGQNEGDLRKTMESELRRVLLGGGEKQQAVEQPKEPPKQEDISAINKLFSDLMAKSNKPAEPSGVERTQHHSNPAPPPGLQNMLNSFGMMSQQRPQVQQHQPRPTHNVPIPATSPVMASSNPLMRLMEQQHLQDKNAQKRSSTPIAFSGFTPTAVMRKMTGDQQSKASPHVTSFGGMPPINSLPTNSINSGFNSPSNVPANNPLASFMSAISAQSQPQPPHPHHQMPSHHQHQQMHPMQQNGPHMHSMGPPHGNMHVPPHHPGFHGPPRMPFPVMVGPPNGGMRAHGQFPPYSMYPPQMPQRK